jgi:iron(III) transport system permease protein
VYGIFLLIPALIGFVFDALNKDKGNSSYTTSGALVEKKTARDVLSYILLIAVSVFVLMPIIVFAILAFSAKYPTDISFTIANLEKALKLRAGTYLINSVLIALFTAIVGTVVCFITAYFTARLKSKTSKVLHLFAITSAAIPGLVLGLSYILVFKGSLVYGTIVLMVMVNVIHFIASPYLMMYNSLSKLNENLEDVGQTLGIGKLRIIANVIIPQNFFTLIEMFAYFFVNSMMTISAVSFLATTANKPIALMITQFEAQMQLEAAAVVSLAILGVNLIVKGIAYLIKYNIKKRSKASKAKEAV